MSTAVLAPPRSWTAARAGRVAPVTLAAALAAVYVVSSPPSLDLAAQLFRTRLFGAEGFALWDNWWYSGHGVLGYSVLFPALAWLITAQLAAAIAAVTAAVLFEQLAYRHRQADAWIGSMVFAAAITAELYSGRLTFVAGVAPALAAVAWLDRGSWRAAGPAALLTALISPVAAVFCALVTAAQAGSARRATQALPGLGVAVTALAPLVAIAVISPEGGSEPFALGTLLPALALALLAAVSRPPLARTLRLGAVLYALLLLTAFLLRSPLGSNAARLATIAAAPLAALVLWPRRRRALAVLALPLLYLTFAAPVRDLTAAAGDPATTAAYYEPLLSFLGRQTGPPFRTEIPFTRLHWEAYEVAPRFPLARGWERQADIDANPLFYGPRLTAARYYGWLEANAVRFVAVPDTGFDYAGRAEAALIARGLPYLSLRLRTRHWRVYALRAPTPILAGPGRLDALGPDWVGFRAQRAGRFLVRVHYTPYWALATGAGCVAPAGAGTAIHVLRPGAVRLAIRFALDRIGARSSRCTDP